MLYGLTAIRSTTIYRSQRGGVVIDGKPAERGRSLVLKDGNLKQPDISIAKFGRGTREAGEAHSTG